MKLEYHVIEDNFDEMTQLRSMTEQAELPGKGQLFRTTVYSAHQLSVDVTYIPGSGQAENFEAIGG